MPDSDITTDLRGLTGEKGEIVFFSLDGKHKNAAEYGRRYGPAKPGAILTDEFGNLLEKSMTHSDDILEAYYYMDELTAEQFQLWNEASAKGKALLEKKEYAAAAAHLQIFAFAKGSKEADQGRRLFAQIAPIAAEELKKLLGGLKAGSLKDLTAAERKALAAKLSAFEKRWPRTTAAFYAGDLKKQLSSKKSAL